MRTTKTERLRAEQVSVAIDQLIRDPNARLEQVIPDDPGVLDTARQLAGMASLLGAVDLELERQVLHQVREKARQTGRHDYFRPGWAAVGLAAALLLVMLLTPLGHTVVASFMAVFDLGHTEVRITPVDGPTVLPSSAAAESSAIQRSLTLVEVQAQVPFAIPQPAYLPRGYDLREVSSYSFPDLPVWVLQPLFVELIYRDGEGDALTLRVYPIMLGEEASISGMNLQAAPIQDVRDVDVNSQPGVLLQLGTDRAEAAWQEVVWEQGDLVLALSTTNLGEADLLRIARSVH
jgi:hypothetical protein